MFIAVLARSMRRSREIGEAEYFAELAWADRLVARQHQTRCQQPLIQMNMRSFEDRSALDVEILAAVAVSTPVDAGLLGDAIGVVHGAAEGTYRAFRPSDRF